MSLTDTLQNQIPNPVKKYLQWSGDRNTLFYWDKDLSQQLDVPLPCTFIVLDTLATIRGWNDSDQCGIYANEVRNILQEDFIVRTFGNKKTNTKSKILATGKYRDIKGSLDGGKFATSAYIYYNNELCNLTMAGSALNAWIDANIKSDGTEIIWAAGPEVSRKGKTEYFIPLIAKAEKLHQEHLEGALQADKELKEYFKARSVLANNSFTLQIDEEIDEEIANIPVEDMKNDDSSVIMPF